MGDRVYAEFKVSKQDYHNYKKEFEKISYNDFNEYAQTVGFADMEANYGTMDEHENFCIENKIEFDLEYAGGLDFLAGCKYGRLVYNEIVTVDLSDETYKKINNLKKLLELKDDPAKLIAEIERQIEDTIPFEITELGRPNSIKFIENS